GRAARADVGAAAGAARGHAAVGPHGHAAAGAAGRGPTAGPDGGAAAGPAEAARLCLGLRQRRQQHHNADATDRWFHGWFPRDVHRSPLTRVTRSGGVSGSGEPAAVRSTDCQVNASLPSGMSRFVAVTSLPSGRVPAASLTQRLPSRFQTASPNVPLL